MNNEIIIAVLSLFGTLVGSLAGILASNKLTTYRLQELEKKVDKHNQVVERVAILERDIKSAHRRIDELKEEIKV